MFGPKTDKTVKTNTNNKIVPKIKPPPPSSDIDDAAVKEAAGINDGTLEFSVQGTRRTIKTYTITSSELEGLSVWNSTSNAASTIGWGLITFVLGSVVIF